jgi:hypothetical protein
VRVWRVAPIGTLTEWGPIYQVKKGAKHWSRVPRCHIISVSSEHSHQIFGWNPSSTMLWPSIAPLL